MDYYIYPFDLRTFQNFEDDPDFDLVRRNHEFIVVTNPISGWLEQEQRNQVMLVPNEGEVLVLAKRGHPDRELTVWLIAHDLRLPHPRRIYF